ncbi:hypothetical protein BX659_10740 [Orenia metallireducens]|jgi:hypothetical protein|uniref:Uncharacterized protein n=1 Tax=Orenia metallireducens TaxID=1413210 RepID=A0A285GFD0_9FIRM|nr:hypothetical protein [Orenia metallireducens]PRX30399.1 hypothetical protein BX659_10740 [Orenia metallireducens]SNY22292.1 hypothetical protein SAMN06265827_10740 [Orenia metallireducens]
MKGSNKFKGRRHQAYVSIFGTTQVHLRNPWIISWWSAAFPGLGHLLLSKYLRGFLLFIWEVYINYQAHVNLAILYSFTGSLEQAKEVIDIRWMLLYIPTYIFAIWDSYRSTVDLNHQYLLATREDADIKIFQISAMEINYLDKRNPMISAIWSFLMPGAGQIYIHRIITASFIMTWWIMLVYYSKLLPAIHYSFLGEFAKAKDIISWHWLLNIPSVYGFALYDAYVNTVENNKLYDWEQALFLKKNYQNKSFELPCENKKDVGEAMHIICTFEYSNYLELAISTMEMQGIKKEDILAIPMDKRNSSRRFFDSIHHSDGLSLLDLSSILGTIFMLLGSIYGFILKWGPIVWGLIGLLVGGFLGLLIRLLISKNKSYRQRNKKSTEVVLIIKCEEKKLELVKDILWENYALGVAKLDLADKVGNIQI